MMDMNKLFKIMEDWIRPIVQSDCEKGYTWGLHDDNLENKFYWHCYNGEHM